MLSTMNPSQYFDHATLEGQASIAAVRERFLADQATDLSLVRPVIANSWRRSAGAGVDPKSRTVLAGDFRIDEQTLRCAEPFIKDLARMIEDLGGDLTLVSPSGSVAMGLTPRTEQRFPVGFVTLEDSWGTNSDGTSIEEGTGIQVWSAEHFSDEMQNLCCTSVLIRDPFRHSIRAVLGVALPERLAMESDPQAIRLIVEGTAAKVAHALSERLAVREQVLLASYLDAVRRSRGGVLAFDERMTIVSNSAMELLDKTDQVVIAGYASEVLESGIPVQREITLSGDRIAHMRISPATDNSREITGGAIVCLQPRLDTPARKGSPQTERKSAAKAANQRRSIDTESLPFTGLIGDSGPFQHALKLAAGAIARGIPAHIIGDPGTGKDALARQIASGLAAAVYEVDCSRLDSHESLVSSVRAALDRGSAVLLSDVDALPESLGEIIAGMLRQYNNPPVIATLRRLTGSSIFIVSALRGVEIPMPPLRMRREDIPALARHFISRCHSHRPARPTDRLLRLLAEAHWPGNVAQLAAVIEDAVAAAGGGELTPDHLPWSFRRTAARGRFSRMEEAELVELRQALSESKGNRTLAADILQIGRSTLYRRIDMYRRRGLDITT
jgi:transcriptional regulator of acetoin/glycerol metabolism